MLGGATHGKTARAVAAGCPTQAVVDALGSPGPPVVIAGGAMDRENFGPPAGPELIISLTLNDFRTAVWMPLVVSARPRNWTAMPELAVANVCPLLVWGSCELPRFDVNDVNDRAVALGVASRLDAMAFSLDLMRL